METGDRAKEGEIVTFPNEDKKGRGTKGIVTEVKPDKDKIIRAVRVKPASGHYIKPVIRLAILDVRPTLRRKRKLSNMIKQFAAMLILSLMNYVSTTVSAVETHRLSLRQHYRRRKLNYLLPV